MSVNTVSTGYAGLTGDLTYGIAGGGMGNVYRINLRRLTPTKENTIFSAISGATTRVYTTSTWKGTVSCYAEPDSLPADRSIASGVFTVHSDIQPVSGHAQTVSARWLIEEMALDEEIGNETAGLVGLVCQVVSTGPVAVVP